MVVLRECMEERYEHWRDSLPADPGGQELGWRAFFDACPGPDFGAILEDLEIDNGEAIWPGCIGEDQQGSHIGRAFHGINPTQVRVVVLGQDPYRQQDQATGRAFEDGAWDENRPDHLADSLQAIFQSALLTVRDDIGIQRQRADWPGVMRAIETGQITLPPRLDAYFDGLAAQGVLFINAAWTFSGRQHKQAHLAFWKPVTQFLLRKLAADDAIGVVFLLLGEDIQKMCWKTDLICRNAAFVSNAHPSPQSARYYFANDNPLTRVNEALDDLGRDRITWWPPA